MSNYSEMVEMFEHDLARHARSGEEARAKFAKSIPTVGNLLYALSWAEATAVTLTLSELWRSIESHYREGSTAGDPIEAMTRVVDQVEEELLGNYNRPASSSAFSNAVTLAQTQAKAQFYREAKSYLRSFRKALTSDTEAALKAQHEQDARDYVAEIGGAES